MNIFTFDIETIPDIAAGKKCYHLEALSDDDAAQALLQLRRQQTDGQDFMPHYLHRVVAISAVFHQNDQITVWSLGESHSSEKELITRFFSGINRYTPTLVTWNGSGFDLPVLHYRALKYAIASPRYWETGDTDQQFRWNNYLSRYHSRHTDVMDILSSYQPRACAPLDKLATILGLPGKMGMSGDKVYASYQQGDIDNIRHYCETDALNTHLIYLRLLLIQGKLSTTQYQRENERIYISLENSHQPHLREFIEHWDSYEKA